MKRELIVQLHASFEQLIHVEEETGVEFWLAGIYKRCWAIRLGGALRQVGARRR